MSFAAAVVAEPASVARRRSGDGRGAALPATRLGPSARQAAARAVSLSAVHSAAHTAGVRIPSELCGLRVL